MQALETNKNYFHQDLTETESSSSESKTAKLNLFSKLPIEIRGYILGRLHPKRLARCSTVCKDWQKISKETFNNKAYFSEYRLGKIEAIEAKEEREMKEALAALEGLYEGYNPYEHLFDEHRAYLNSYSPPKSKKKSTSQRVAGAAINGTFYAAEISMQIVKTVALIASLPVLIPVIYIGKKNGI